MTSYKLGSYSKQQVSVNDLEVDEENFRIGKQPDQLSAIEAIINRNGAKVLGIANSIIANGFLDLETVCVFPKEGGTGKYVVAEGNRRITALKVMHAPDLAKNTHFFKTYKDLSKKAKKLPSSIECAVFKSRKDCLLYVLMRHGYITDGSGVVRWDSLSKLRADGYLTGKTHPEVKVIEYVLSKGSLSEAHQNVIEDDKFYITNLQRLTDDKSVKGILQIDTNDCTSSSLGEAWLLPVWERVVETIIIGKHRGEKFTVDNNLNKTKDRQKFINEIISDVHHASHSTGAGVAQNNSSGNIAQPKVNGKSAAAVTPKSVTVKGPKGKSLQTTKARTGLIQKSFSPANLTPQKVINLVGELKGLPVKDYPNSTGVMFRVFFELSVAYYMKKHNIGTFNTDGKELALKDKTKKVIKHLEGVPSIPSKDLKPLRDVLTSAHPLSASSLNQYVHNANYQPEASALKIEWDNLQHVFELMWGA